MRELRRQIASLYYERSGLSKDKVTLAALAQQGAERAGAALNIRDPYIFDVPGIEARGGHERIPTADGLTKLLAQTVDFTKVARMSPMKRQANRPTTSTPRDDAQS